ncbi:MAG: cellulase family glycosylhydrolase [Chloroflexota bacterium]
MSKTKLKLLIWLFLGFVAVAIGLGIVRFVSGLIQYFNQGADAASVLNIVPNVPVDLAVDFEWLDIEHNTGREMEPFTSKLIQGQYMRAWLQWNISYLKGEPLGLSSYFNGPAFHAITESVEFSQEEGWIMTHTDLDHNLELHFYSADGSIISFTDHDVHVAEIIRDGDGTPITARVTKADYDVVMFLLDGIWKVRHWARTDAEIIDPSAYESPKGGADFVMRNGRNLILNGDPFTIRGINYYPQDQPWELFWAHYDSETVDSDFALIKELGLNSVRIFIPNEWPAPPQDEVGGGHGAAEEIEEEEIQQYMLDNLEDLLGHAEKHDLKVIVTLFDFRTDYQILVWPDADKQLSELIPHFADNPTILAWDIKNEPDFDRAGNSPEMVDTWLGHITYRVRQHDPNHLVTIGWASPESAHLLADTVDFVSFHYYDEAQSLPGKMTDLQNIVGEKPIVVTEFGLPTLNSAFSPGGHTQNEQAVYYANIRRSLASVDNAGYMAWTLYDFPVASKLAGGDASQKHLGVIDKNGRVKLAALMLAEHWEFAPPQMRLADRLLKPFYLTVFVAISMLGFMGVLAVRLMKPTFAGWFVDPTLRFLAQVWQPIIWGWRVIGKGRRFAFKQVRKVIFWCTMPIRLTWRGGHWLKNLIFSWLASILGQIVGYFWDLWPFIFIRKIGTNILAKVKQRLDNLKNRLELDKEQE